MVHCHNHFVPGGAVVGLPYPIMYDMALKGLPGGSRAHVWLWSMRRGQKGIYGMLVCSLCHVNWHSECTCMKCCDLCDGCHSLSLLIYPRGLWDGGHYCSGVVSPPLDIYYTWPHPKRFAHASQLGTVFNVSVAYSYHHQGSDIHDGWPHTPSSFCIQLSDEVKQEVEESPMEIAARIAQVSTCVCMSTYIHV